MSKKFDVVIGNPPYQSEAKGESGRAEPIYHHFMEAAYEVADKAVLITPARFLFDAGQTPKQWNQKMLNDPHLSVPVYEPDSKKIFPGPDIKGGIAVTYRDSSAFGVPIGTFSPSRSLINIVTKVNDAGERSLQDIIESKSAYGWTALMHKEHPQAVSLMSPNALSILSPKVFVQLDFLFSPEPLGVSSDSREVFGLVDGKRTSRWVKSSYIRGPKNMSAYKVAVPGANGTGVFGEILSSPTVLGPNTAATQTFITIGSFKSAPEAEACLKYVKSKFARAMLGVLKVTQNNARGTWKHVPLQDFTSASDIDWSRPLPQIDQQLYAKYKLSGSEISFIESHVKPMG
jgi:hypothetical protein